jgi:hypothetical protein
MANEFVARNGIISSGSVAVVGSVSVNNAVTASFFKGDGSQLTNIAGASATASYVEYTNVANKPTLISASSQVDHNSTTNYVANQHIDHSTVSISPGSGLTGGGTIAATRTLTLDTGSTHFIGGGRKVVTSSNTTGASGINLNYNQTTGNISASLVNSSVTVNGQSISLGGSGTVTANTTNTLTLGNGLTGTSFNGGTAVTTNVDTGSAHFTNGVKSKMNADGVFSSSAQVSYTGLSSIPSGIVSSSTQIPPLLPNGTVSASSQVQHNLTTGYVANEHIDHSTVSISPGSGLSGGGTIAATRTLTLDTGSTHFTNGVKAKMNTDAVVSSSAQVTALLPNGTVSASSQVQHNSTTGYVANEHINHTSVSITAGSGLSGGGDISATRTVTLDTGSLHFERGVRAEITGSNTTGASGINLNYNQTTGNISASLVNSSLTVNGQAISLGGTGTITANTTNALTLGNGLTGTSFNGGTAVTTNVDTGSIHFTNGVKSKMNVDGVFSSSAQVSYTGLSSIPSGIVSSSTQIPPLLPNGTVSASSQVSYTGLSNTPSGIVSSSTQIPALLPNGTVSASSQVAHNSTSGYVANQHIDHSTVSISPGSGLTGGGTIAATRTLTLDTASVHFTNGVKAKMNTDAVVSSSGQVAAYPNIATTGSNTFTGIQTVSNTTNSTAFNNGAVVIAGGLGVAKDVNISGSLNVTGLLTVVSMSTQYVTSSQYTIGTSRIILNNDDNIRFSGVSINDSGSSAATASILWDSLNNHFIYETDDIHNGNVTPHSALLLAGPESYALPGNEIGLVSNRVPIAKSDHNLDNRPESSSIRIDFPSRLTHIEAGLYVTGSITSSVGFSGNGTNLTNVTAASVTFANVTGKPTLVSASSQVDHNATTNYVANQHIDHSTVSISPGSGLTGGGTIAATRTLTLDTSSAHFTGGVTTAINARGVFSSSAQVSYTGLSSIPSGIVSGAAQIPPLLPNGTVSASSQVAHNSTTGYVANEHINHTSVSISAGSGLTGGGDISATRTLTLDTGSTHFTGGVTTRVNALGVFSSSAQVAHNSTTGYVANEHINHTTVSISAGSGLTGGGDISATRTLSLTGQALALHNLATDGIIIRSGSGAVTARSIAVSGTGLSIANANGLAGNPTITIGGGVFSSSGQVNHNITTNYVANQHIDHSTVSISAGSGMSGGGTIAATRTLTLDTGSTHFTGGVTTAINARGVFSSSAQVSYTGLSSIPSGIVSSSTQIPALLPNGTVSASSQVAHNSTTGYVANEHINHTTVSISAGSGLTGGGDISATRTLTLDTGSVHFTGGVRKLITSSNTTGASGINLNYNQTTGNISASLVNSSITVNGSAISLGGSATVTANTTNTLTLGNGLTGTSFNGSAAVTATVDTASAHFTNGVTTRINALGVFSSSAQVAHNSTTGYVANQHIDHSTVSISPGLGLTGGGTIAATRTLTLDTGSAHFTGGVTTRVNALGVYSSSAQVDINSATGTLTVNKGGTGQTSYVNGELLIGNTTGNTLSKATLTGTANRILITNGAGSITIDADADSANTVNKIVARDASGNFAGGTITANTLIVGTQAAKATISYATNTARTLTIPSLGGNRTFAFINQAQTISAVQTFSANPVLSAATAILSFSSTTGTKTISTAGTTDLALSPGGKLIANANTDVSGSLDVTGAFSAQTKSFKIDHQELPGKKLVYGVLEGPEHAVYVRGKLTNNNEILLPDEWSWLVDMDSITVQLTPIGSGQKLYIESIVGNKIIISNDNMFNKQINCYYLVHATRKDVPQLQTVV